MLSVLSGLMTGACAKCDLFLMRFLPIFLTTVRTDIDADKLLGGIMDVIIQVGKISGVVLIAIALVQFFFAFKEENADAQSKAVRLMAVGIGLMGLQVFMRTVGIINTSAVIMPLLDMFNATSVVSTPLSVLLPIFV